MPLYRPSELHAFIEQMGHGAKKSLSQNFLIDGNILEKILQAADVQKGDLVLEIGPGPGALTEALLARGAEVVAIEKDALFAKELRRLQGNLTVHEADFLEFDLSGFQNAKVVANLPYQITTPILQKLLPLAKSFTSLTLMVQREFGERLVAKPDTSEYSSLTLFARYYADARYCFLVKPSSFYPRPGVDSCVVHLALRKEASAVSPDHFFSITRRAFQQRRKMLRSSLKELFSPEKIERVLTTLGLVVGARPEQLSYEQFELLAQRLYQQ